jgi:hypothetical protein
VPKNKTKKKPENSCVQYQAHWIKPAKSTGTSHRTEEDENKNNKREIFAATN